MFEPPHRRHILCLQPGVSLKGSHIAHDPLAAKTVASRWIRAVHPASALSQFRMSARINRPVLEYSLQHVWTHDIDEIVPCPPPAPQATPSPTIHQMSLRRREIIPSPTLYMYTTFPHHPRDEAFVCRRQSLLSQKKNHGRHARSFSTASGPNSSWFSLDVLPKQSTRRQHPAMHYNRLVTQSPRAGQNVRAQTRKPRTQP